MSTCKFFRWLAGGVLATVCVACSSSAEQHVVPASGTAASPAIGREVAPKFQRPKVATEHLYVIVTTSTKFVAEYPIQSGIPQTKPDRVVRGFFAPNALTVDGAGRLYVLDVKGVKVFAPGATGHAQPIREIDVPSFLNFDTLAVDAHGYLYVGESEHVVVYSPSAHGHAKPVAVLKPAGYPAGLGIYMGGDLYALGNTQHYGRHRVFRTHVTVYSAAPTPKRIRGFCTRELFKHGIDYGVALDGLGRLFTTHTEFINSLPVGEIDVFDATAKGCPVNKIAKITTSNPRLLEPAYLAVSTPYIYVADVQQGNGGVVFTLRSAGVRQTPVATLSISNGRPHDLYGMALGP